MTGWYAVFRKEVAHFFVSPIAYSIIAIFTVISGFFFWANISMLSILSLQAASNPMYAQRINLTNVVIRPVAGTMSIVLLLLMPLITMRLFAEEKRSGTMELIQTYPIGDMGVLAGKFLASLFVLAVMLAATGCFPLFLIILGKPDPGTLIGCYLGLLLMGAAFMALGAFISSLTENQIVAAVVSFGVALLLWVISYLSSFSGEAAGAVLKQLSILERLESFQKGVLSLGDISYFVLFSAFFLFLTLRSLEVHRWRG